MENLSLQAPLFKKKIASAFLYTKVNSLPSCLGQTSSSFESLRCILDMFIEHKYRDLADARKENIRTGLSS